MAGSVWRGLSPVVVTGLLLGLPYLALAQAPLSADAQLEPIEFTLEDVRYRISMPRRSRLSDVNKAGCLKIWHPRASRLMKFLELCSASGSIPTTFPRATTLTNGVRVSYTIDRDVGGGSGGTEGELKGRIELNGKLFALTCRDQGEWGNDPGWCLHYLGSLVVKARRAQ